MTDTHYEQHPLLYVSDEELPPHDLSARLSKRYCKNRAGYKVKGAAAILTHWPDHWSSSVKYWWFLLVMLFIIVLLVYNCVAVFTLSSIQPWSAFTSNTEVTPVKTLDLPQVFMHKIIQADEELYVKYYLPHIKVISDEYPEYKYNFIILSNDTEVQEEDEKNNELAMNFLLNNDNSLHKRETEVDLTSFKGKLRIIRTSLSSYLNHSPLKKHWRYIPHQFIEFLVRTVSIWEKGGIAFNPDILTPKSPHALYMKKIKSILKHNRSSTHKYGYTIMDNKIPRKPVTQKSKKKMNNIREIIDAMEDNTDTGSLDNLDAAENKVHDKVNWISILRKREAEPKDLFLKTNKTSSTTNRSILISFLKLILSDQQSLQNDDLKHTEDETQGDTQKQRRSITFINKDEKSLTAINKDELSDRKHSLFPMIIAKKAIEKSQDITSAADEELVMLKELIVDLKGNIIATATACHAFVGTLFTDAINHAEDETLTNFLISELTIFCKGHLSSCDIDVILV